MVGLSGEVGLEVFEGLSVEVGGRGECPRLFPVEGVVLEVVVHGLAESAHNKLNYLITLAEPLGLSVTIY